MMTDNKAQAFEESYKMLEQVIQKLEEGELPLDESVALYEKGISLVRHCEQQLEQAELRVSQLLSDAEHEVDAG